MKHYQQKDAITVGQLIKQLSLFPADCEIYFEGFDFYRLKYRGLKKDGTEILQIELNEKETFNV